MTCEQAINLISSRLDNEISADAIAWLNDHLATCECCRATADAFALQDTELRACFEGHRQTAAVLAERVIHYLEAPPAAPRPSVTKVRPRLWSLAAAALVIAGAATLLLSQARLDRQHESPAVQDNSPDPVLGNGLVARPRAKPRDTKRLKIGETLETQAAQKRRALLPDGSVVLVNSNSALRVDSERHVALKKGEIFVEVAARKSNAEPFVAQTPDRIVIADGSMFAVQAADPQPTSVLVAKGSVQVDNVELHAGEQLVGDATAPTPAIRASCALDWTRDLIAESETPLIPASEFAGGALIAVDANGQEAHLTLRKFHIDVHIEDGFARTTIDQTYFNHASGRLEGTFYFPLPADASLNRLAMYVNGELMEGGMAERQHAEQVYESIKRTMRDPALLEWVNGTTFKMRVFPLEGRQEKRIVLSYVQRLSVSYGTMQYRFPAGHTLRRVDDWSFHGVVKNALGLSATCPSHPDMKITTPGDDLVLDASAKPATLDHDVAINLIDSFKRSAPDRGRFTTHEQDGYRYLMMRYRPQMEESASPTQAPRRWIFIFDSSADRDPLLARTQVEIIRNLLQYAEPGDQFAVIAANSRVHTFAPDLLPVTGENVAAAIDFLDHSHLIGALNLGEALDQAATYEGAKPQAASFVVHVGTGFTALGDKRDDGLIARLPSGARYVGIGVGKEWSRAFMKRAAEATGGYFTQINPDESIAWRSFELISTLRGPRLVDVRVNDVAQKFDFLTMGSSIAQGEEICAITRVPVDEALPEFVVIKAQDGYKKVLSVDDASGSAAYLPRVWARLEIDRLLAEDAEKNKQHIIELSKAMYVMSPFTSLLVLENEAMYKQYNVDRGRKDHWAMYPCPEKIKVVYEPLANGPVDQRNAPRQDGDKPSASVIKRSILQWQDSELRNDPSDASSIMSSLIFDDEKQRFRRWQVEDSTPMLQGLKEVIRRQENVHMLNERKRHLIRPTEPFKVYQNPLDPTYPDGTTSTLMFAESYAGYIYVPQYYRTPSALIHSATTHIGMGMGGLAPGGIGMGGMGAFIGGRYGTVQGMPAGMGGIMGMPAGGMGMGRMGGGGGGMGMGMMPSAGGGMGMGMMPGGGSMGSGSGASSQSGSPSMPATVRLLHYYDSDVRDAGPPILSKIPYLDRLFRNQARSTWSFGPFDLVEPVSQGDGLSIYHRPTWRYDNSVFTNLLAYAPGMNVSAADVQAVLEAEAAPDLSALTGHIDPEARKLIDQVRSNDWQEVVFFDDDGKPSLTVYCNAAGSFNYERTLMFGLKEQVSCDGSTLLHLYPEIGVGGKRTVSRFHRAEFAQMASWILPPAEDLAHGADVRLIDEHTVAIIPADITGSDNNIAIHLVVRDGKLLERQYVAIPDKKVLARELYTEDAVRLLDADGKEIYVRKIKITPLQRKREVRPDLDKLVVLPMPFRSREHVFPLFGLDPNTSLYEERNLCYQYLEGDAALATLASLVFDNSRLNSVEIKDLYHHCFFDHGDRRPGLFLLMTRIWTSSYQWPDFVEASREQPDNTLIAYLSLIGSNPGSQQPSDVSSSIGKRSGFLATLGEFWSIYHALNADPSGPWSSLVTAGTQAAAFDFIHRHRSDILGCLLLTLLDDQSNHTEEMYGRLASAWGEIAKPQAAFPYVAQYEQARCLFKAGRKDGARQQFLDLFGSAIKERRFPLVDDDFRSALRSTGDDGWTSLLLSTADTWIKDNNSAAIVYLAWLASDFGDRPLADALLNRAIEAASRSLHSSKGDGWVTYLAAVEYLQHDKRTQKAQAPRALELVEELLSDDKLGTEPELWRLASALAFESNQESRSIACLEKALDLEYQNLPAIIDLEQIRVEYERLLQHYQTIARSSQDLKPEVTHNLAARLVRAADRWRALDPGNNEPSSLAAQAFADLGGDDLAWDYLTTQFAVSGRTTSAWSKWEDRQNEFLRRHPIAVRVLTVTSEEQPNDMQVLWEWALELKCLDRQAERRSVLRKMLTVKPAIDGQQAYRRWAELELGSESH